MPLDAVCLGAVVEELKAQLINTRIDKVFQPERDEVILSMRGGSGTMRLLICASASNARIHLTDRQKENPASPPMFCMLLRKHLTGARIKEITQPHLERAVDIVMDTFDEMGVRSEKTLTAELMGKHSNIILRGADGRIIDCVKRVDAGMSQLRQVLPGLFYHLPPAQNKRDFLSVGSDELAGLLSAASPDTPADKWLLDSFFGLSPLVCRELVARATGDAGTRLCAFDAHGRERLLAEFEALQHSVNANNFTPNMVLDGDQPYEFSYMEITQYLPKMQSISQESFSRLLESFYSMRDDRERMARRSQELTRLMTSTRDRVARRLAAQMTELEATRNKDRLRQLGDILSANFYTIPKGARRVRLADFFDPEGMEVEIELDERLTPQQNAAAYYKKYTRARTAETKLTEQLIQGRRELDYLDSVLDELSRAASAKELAEIRQELCDTGYISAKGRQSKTKEKASRPLSFVSSSGMHIYAGRNNRQNDLLTMKTASKRDLWLHVQKIHGCHVVIDCSQGEPDDQTITQAAQIAAYYSQARDSHNVPVDYTSVKNVKKPPGAKPGMVIYENFKTAFVVPDRALVESLAE